MGNLAAAEKLYDQARDRYVKLENAEPGNPEHRRRRSDVLNDVALVYKGTNRRQEAESTWQKALAVREHLRGEFPENRDYASAVAATQINLGLLHHEDGRFDQATTEYRNALASELCPKSLPIGHGGDSGEGLPRRH
jgi:tetratricopeptide (TPR) repeat protein